LSPALTHPSAYPSRGYPVGTGNVLKYVSDKYAGQKDALVEVPGGGSFADMVALKGDKEIGDKINKIIAKLAEANSLKGVIDQTDFN
jgi:type I restriction enzyme M protein